MKILHIITSLKIGGAESALVNFLRHKKHEHIVAYFYHGPNVKKLEAMGIKTHQIKGFISYADPLALLRLARLIKKTKPDIIHSALWSANIIGRIMARLFNIPIVCDVHGNSFDEGKIRNWFDRATVKYATHIIAVSKSAHDAYYENIMSRRTLSSGRGGRERPALLTIKNGIDYLSVRATAGQNPLSRAQFGLEETDFVIGAIGRLEPIKSYDILVNALRGVIGGNALYQNIKLIIIGGGSQEVMLKKLIIDLGIENNVILTGQRTDALRFYPLFDCFALSSQSEGLSISLLEALCFGLPIITTNKTKKHDVIVHGVNGLLVQPNNIAALAHAILTLTQNASLKISMQKNNRELIEKDFSITKTVQNYHAIYARCIDKNKQNKP